MVMEYENEVVKDISTENKEGNKISAYWGGGNNYHVFNHSTGEVCSADTQPVSVEQQDNGINIYVAGELRVRMGL